MSTKSKKKLPSDCVVATRGAINALPCTVTVAPGTPAPEESVTVPAIFPVIATCAKVAGPKPSKTITKTSAAIQPEFKIDLLIENEDRICSPLSHARIPDLDLDNGHPHPLVP